MDQASILITIVSAVFGFVIGLLIYIWTLTQKINDKRHEEHQLIIKELSANQTDQKMILIELRAMVSYHEKKLEKQ